MVPPTLQHRPLQPDDFALGMRLKQIAGWNQTLEDWRTLVDLNPDGCFVGLVDGEPAGTVTTTLHGSVGWIGMVVVVYAALGLLAEVEKTFNIIYRAPDDVHGCVVSPCIGLFLRYPRS